MPITSLTFLVGTLAIAGVPLLSGFYSKDAILASVLGFSWTHRAHWILFILPALAAALTAFYMMRLYLLTFHTTARDEHVHEHAHESPTVDVGAAGGPGGPVDLHRLVRTPARAQFTGQRPV